jgi:hypothetical protein
MPVGLASAHVTQRLNAAKPQPKPLAAKEHKERKDEIPFFVFFAFFRGQKIFAERDEVRR